MVEQLKACPFCGGPAQDDSYGGAVCATGRGCFDDVLSHQRWNTRPLEAALESALAAAKARVAELERERDEARATAMLENVWRSLVMDGLGHTTQAPPNFVGDRLEEWRGLTPKMPRGRKESLRAKAERVLIDRITGLRAALAAKERG